MDHNRFDAFARIFAADANRRVLMKGLTGTGAATLFGVHSLRRATAARRTAQDTGEPGVPGCEEIDCPPGRVYSPDACACVCAVECPPNFAPDPTTCNCYCTLSDFYECPRADHVYDDGLCACVCAIEDCPGDAVLDPDTCQCFCPSHIACEPGETIEPTTCECVCTRACTPPEILDDCLCVCGIDECEPPFKLDEDACACICDRGNEDCASPFVLDPEACDCICPPDLACPIEKRLDPGTCTCVCPPAPACPPPTVPDPKTCACGCPPNLTCPVAQVLNPESCECVCPPDVACRDDQTLDPETCVCVCPPGANICNDRCVDPCLPTQAYDDECQCEEIICPPDRVLTCTCACPPGLAECKGDCLPACRQNQVFDDACRCVCRPNIACDLRRVLDPTTCECTCLSDLTCPPGHMVDPASCQCVCEPGRLLETITMPVNRASVMSTTTLEPGVRYRLRASGTFVVGVAPLDMGDAEYAFDGANPNLMSNTRDRCGPGGNNADLGIAIDDPVVGPTKSPDWGPYNPAHIYEIDFVGTGAPISLNYHDCFPRDNQGSLTVEIFCPDDSGDPGPPDSSNT